MHEEGLEGGVVRLPEIKDLVDVVADRQHTDGGGEEAIRWKVLPKEACEDRF
jgi:hypothetical protein